MLAQLTSSNFAIVRELEIDLQPGMTAITCEIGSGKSIAIDVLVLCLGNRADGNVVRRLGVHLCADICTRFSLADTPFSAYMARAEPVRRQQRMSATLSYQRHWILARLHQWNRRTPVVITRAGPTLDSNSWLTRPLFAAQARPLERTIRCLYR